MAIARVQAPLGGVSASGGSAFSITITASGANNFLMACGYTSDGVMPASIKAGTTSFTQDATGTTSEGVFIYSLPNCAAGLTSITFTPTGGSFIIGFVAEYSGIATSTPFDQTSYHVTASSTSYSSNTTPTLSQAVELCIGIAATGQSASDSLAASGSWTNPVVHKAAAGDGDDARWQELIVNSTTGQAATGTNTSVTRLQALIATYKGAAAGGSRGLFEQTPMNGLGVGGSFFANPLSRHRQPHQQEWSRHGRIFVPRHTHEGRLLEKAA